MQPHPDSIGKGISTVIDMIVPGLHPPGAFHRVPFALHAHLPSGLYLYVLITEAGTACGRMVIAR